MKTILLVEDNPAVLDSIKLALEVRGFRVMGARDGKQAIEVLKATSTLPDVIVSDIEMPEMNGYEFLETVQKQPAWSYIPFIFLTAYGTEQDVRTGRKKGVDDYVVKPFDPDDLVLIIENKIRRADQWQQSAEHKLETLRHELLQLLSHELRTPMNVIHGGTQMLEAQLHDEASEITLTSLELVRSGIKRMNRLINQVILLARFESGYFKREFARAAHPISVVSALEIAWTQLNWEFKRSDIQIKWQLPDKRPTVPGLDELLNVAFREVLHNALHFTPEGGTITIQVTSGDKEAQISIQDEGSGIAPDDLARIWNYFTQSERNKKEHQGAGLGLSLTRHSIETHGGRCDIESQIGKGTKVIIYLPAWQDEEGEFPDE